MPEVIRSSDQLEESMLTIYNTEGGEADSIFRSDIRLFTITNIDVLPEHRRQGIGKVILENMKAHARELGAVTIMSAILSRECLDAMVSVFGDEYINVAEEGTYHSPEEYPDIVVGDTRAMLLAPVDKLA